MRKIVSLAGVTLCFVLPHLTVQGSHVASLDLPATSTLVSLAVDKESNTYVLSAFSNSVEIAGKSFVSQGGTDYLLAQYGPDGSVGWAISFGSPLDEVSSPSANLCVGPDGVWVSGSQSASMLVVDTAGQSAHTAYQNQTDCFLLKFSRAGVSQWQASLTGKAINNSYALTTDDAGNAYWAGAFNTCCPSPGFASLTGGDGKAIEIDTDFLNHGTGFLAKLSPLGAIVWVATANNLDASFNEVAVDASGGVIVAGYSHSASAGKQTLLIDASRTSWAIANAGLQSSFAAKFDSSGSYQWSVASTGWPEGLPYLLWDSMTVATNGDVFLAGSYNTAAVSLTGVNGVVESLPSPQGQEGFVAALNSFGSIKWLRQIGGGGTDVVHSVSVGASGAITLAGQMTSGLNAGDTNISGLGNADGFVTVLDPEGNLTNGFAVGGPANDDVRFVVAGDSGYDVIAGQQGGNFLSLGVHLTNAGPYVLVARADDVGPCVTHRATATARVLDGAVVGVTVTDGGCGYTNPPVILIQGGGGTGAAAQAVLHNGVVVNILIIAAGTGYTNSPNALIASPPFMPWVEVGLSKVKVKLHLLLGKNYVLEASPDMQTWTQVEPQFTAQSELIEQEFDLNQATRFFNLRQVP